MSISHNIDEEAAFRLMMEALAASDIIAAARWLEIANALHEREKGGELQ